MSKRGASLHALHGLTLSPLYRDSPVSSRSQNVSNPFDGSLCVASPVAVRPLSERDHVVGEWAAYIRLVYVVCMCQCQCSMSSGTSLAVWGLSLTLSFPRPSSSQFSVSLRQVVSWHHNTHAHVRHAALAHPPTCGHSYITWQISMDLQVVLIRYCCTHARQTAVPVTVTLNLIACGPSPPAHRSTEEHQSLPFPSV